jgi:hypothetical protein
VLGWSAVARTWWSKLSLRGRPDHVWWVGHRVGVCRCFRSAICGWSRGWRSESVQHTPPNHVRRILQSGGRRSGGARYANPPAVDDAGATLSHRFHRQHLESGGRRNGSGDCVSCISHRTYDQGAIAFGMAITFHRSRSAATVASWVRVWMRMCSDGDLVTGPLTDEVGARSVYAVQHGVRRGRAGELSARGWNGRDSPERSGEPGTDACHQAEQTVERHERALAAAHRKAELARAKADPTFVPVPPPGEAGVADSVVRVDADPAPAGLRLPAVALSASRPARVAATVRTEDVPSDVKVPMTSAKVAEWLQTWMQMCADRSWCRSRTRSGRGPSTT